MQIDTHRGQFAAEASGVELGDPHGLAGLGEFDPEVLVRLLQGTDERPQALEFGGHDVDPVR